MKSLDELLKFLQELSNNIFYVFSNEGEQQFLKKILKNKEFCEGNQNKNKMLESLWGFFEVLLEKSHMSPFRQFMEIF